MDFDIVTPNYCVKTSENNDKNRIILCTDIYDIALVKYEELVERYKNTDKEINIQLEDLYENSIIKDCNLPYSNLS